VVVWGPAKFRGFFRVEATAKEGTMGQGRIASKRIEEKRKRVRRKGKQRENIFFNVIPDFHLWDLSPLSLQIVRFTNHHLTV
jgi:hypothetical protein